MPVRGDVREIDAILAAQGLTHADRVVSGVPFALFTGRERQVILTKTSNLLVAGGRFVAFGRPLEADVKKLSVATNE